MCSFVEALQKVRPLGQAVGKEHSVVDIILVTVSTHLDRIQSIAVQKRAGANTQPWRTPEVVCIGSASCCPQTLIRNVVRACKCSISWVRKRGTPQDRRVFHSTARSTKWITTATAKRNIEILNNSISSLKMFLFYIQTNYFVYLIIIKTYH